MAASERPRSSRERAATRARVLSDVTSGATVRISAVDLPAETAAWVAAVGLSPGETVTMLRRAILGGPLHVRLERGGELAIARDVAKLIAIEDV